MLEIIKSVLDGYADAQCNLASNEARALLAKDINDALILANNLALAKDERRREATMEPMEPMVDADPK